MTKRASQRKPPARRSYASLESFYRADPRRVRSRERDVGLWWREHADGPLYRAAWVADTGELYLARLGPDAGDAGERVELLARVEDPERLEHELEGWRERCGDPGSLSWLRERACALAPAAQPVRRPRFAQRRVLGVQPRPSVTSAPALG